MPQAQVRWAKGVRGDIDQHAIHLMAEAMRPGAPRHEPYPFKRVVLVDAPGRGSVLGFVLRNDPALQDQILSSTLAQFPIVGDHPGRNVVLEALREAWRNFVSVLAASIASMGYLVPIGALVWGAIVAGRRYRRQPA